jgi:enoyl-CoA hydratase
MIEVSYQGQIAVVTMTHGKANTMDTEFADALWSCFGELREASAKAVVLTGQGNIFSASVDLLRAHNSGPQYFYLVPRVNGWPDRQMRYFL